MEKELKKILKERLVQFDVPSEVRNEILNEVLNLIGRPERHKTGATFMTPEASMDGDRWRRGEKAAGHKPHVD